VTATCVTRGDELKNASNFKNRGAATFFKDITTIGALMIFAVHVPTPNKESRS
jgi:hypothetical protein